jgi:putative peptide zinc metalloprotease protein
VRNLFFRLGWLEFEMVRRWALGSASDCRGHQPGNHADGGRGGRHPLPAFLQQQQLLRHSSFKSRPPLWKRILHGYLFIRLPLIRPEKALRRFLPGSAGCSAYLLLVTLLAALSGLVLAARQWDSVQAALHGALSWNGALAFAVALIFSKCWHELGHAFVATRHGVRVGHMGVALLVLWPMAYTDTGELEAVPLAAPAGDCQRRDRGRTDAGRLGDAVLELCAGRKRQNALFFLATTAWVMTVAVNASPFMRFDGYYILSDWLDYPALHERAGNWAKRWMRGHLLGLDDPLPDNVSPAFSRFLTLFAFATGSIA